MSRKLAIRSLRVVLPEEMKPACVVVENERITAITAHYVLPGDAELLDFGNDCILPGLVDTHIHINEPGRTEWEGFSTATRAAASGGYTCVVDMPLNSIPATDSVDALERKRASAADKAMVDYAFWGGAVEGNAGNLRALADHGVAGFKTFLIPPRLPEFTMLGESGLRSAMPVIAQTGLPLLVHAELPGPIDRARREIVRESKRKYDNYLRSRPPEAEVEAIRMMIRLAREFQCRVHIVHLAAPEAYEHLTAARAEGLPITVETCPHYLYFTAENVPDGATQFKCAPPIRDAGRQADLWMGLRGGIIDMVVTDHSPCPPEMKALLEGDFQTAWAGIVSNSVALSAMWTKARDLRCSISDIARWMSERPASLAGISDSKGRIAVGYDADLTIFDPDQRWLVTEDKLHFRHKTSPYLKETLYGLVKATFVRGNLVYDRGSFPMSPQGREANRNV